MESEHKPEFREALARLRSCYNLRLSEAETRAQAEAFFDVLESMPIDVVIKAIARAPRSMPGRSFMPTASEVYALCKELHKGVKAQAPASPNREPEGKKFKNAVEIQAYLESAPDRYEAMARRWEIEDLESGHLTPEAKRLRSLARVEKLNAMLPPDLRLDPKPFKRHRGRSKRRKDKTR